LAETASGEPATLSPGNILAPQGAKYIVSQQGIEIKGFGMAG